MGVFLHVCNEYRVRGKREEELHVLSERNIEIIAYQHPAAPPGRKRIHAVAEHACIGLNFPSEIVFDEIGIVGKMAVHFGIYLHVLAFKGYSDENILPLLDPDIETEEINDVRTAELCLQIDVDSLYRAAVFVYQQHRGTRCIKIVVDEGKMNVG